MSIPGRPVVILPGKRPPPERLDPPDVAEIVRVLNGEPPKVCPACGTAFPEPEKPPVQLHNDDIMGFEGAELIVNSWVWRVHTSRTSGMDMLKVTYYGKNLTDKPVIEYVTVAHEGYAGEKARRTLQTMAHSAGVSIAGIDDLHDLADAMNAARGPREVIYKQDGQFFRVLGRTWAPKVQQDQLELVQ